MKKIDTIKLSGKLEFTIKIEKEDDGFVGYVLENNVSSFGDTVEEALAMTQEALALWVEGEVDYRLKKIANIAQGYIDIPKDINTSRSLSHFPPRTWTIAPIGRNSISAIRSRDTSARLSHVARMNEMIISLRSRRYPDHRRLTARYIEIISSFLRCGFFMVFGIFGFLSVAK